MTGPVDPDRVAAVDRGGILEAFLSMPHQLVASYRSARALDREPFAPATVTFCGMGGSAAAGDALVVALGELLLVPVTTHRGYVLPPHCGRGDLVVCLSYSGSTEETLAAYAEAVSRGCRVAAVSAGGELAERGEADGEPAALIPDGLQPRAALGHLTGAVLGSLASLGVIPDPWDEVEELRRSLEALAEELSPERGGGDAAGVAEWIGDRVPVVWGSEGAGEPAAWRWKCAFNENAKVPAFASSLPELDHHEVAGWAEDRGSAFAVVALRHEGEHPSVAPRLRASLEAVALSGLEAREVLARGGGHLAAVLTLMLLGDATSVYHAVARGVDPTPIEAIDRVKARLAASDG